MSLAFIICMLRGHRQQSGTQEWRPVKRIIPGAGSDDYIDIWLCCCVRCGLAYWKMEKQP